MAERRRGPKPRDATPAVVPLARLADLDPPDDLDAATRRHWMRTTAKLESAGMLADLDTDALFVYCSLWARREKALKECKKRGEIIRAPNGYMMQNPWFTMAVQCEKDMRPYLDMFGMSPKARTKIHNTNVAAPDDKFAEFDD